MSVRIIGIDIRHDAAFAVMLKAGMKRVQIEAVAETTLAERQGPEADLRQLLQGLAEQMDFAGAVVAVAFPEDDFFVRRLEFPFRNTTKIRQTLPFEIETTLPAAVDELTLDFNLLPQPEKGRKQPVLATAVNSEQLAMRMAVLAEFNIDPERVTVGAWPSAAAIPAQPARTGADDTDTTVLLLTERPPFWCIFVCDKQKVVATRNFRLAADNDQLPPGLTQQVQLTMASMLDRGELAALPGIGYYDGPLPANASAPSVDGLSGPLEPLDLIGLHQLTSAPETVPDRRYNNALALALCHLQHLETPNFHSHSGRTRRFVEEHRALLTGAAILLAVVILLTGFNAWLDLHLLNRRVERLDQQIHQEFKAAFPEVKRIVDPIRQMQAKISAAKAEPGGDLLAQRDLNVVDIINAISQNFPAGWNLLLTDVTVGPDNMTLTGTTNAFNTVDQIRDRLAGQLWVDSAVIAAANMNKSGDKVRFKIRVNFTAPAAS